MKKITFLCSILACSYLSVASAGSMSAPEPLSLNHPYVAGEASYTWQQIDTPRINGVSPSMSKQPWGFRLSGGLLRFYTDKLGFSAELGGGYYGGRSGSAPLISTTAKIKIDGYDALLGVLYRLEHLDLFAKFGFMMQNNRFNYTKGDLAQTLPGAGIFGSESQRLLWSGTLPEIRVGGIYNVLDNVGVTLTYMHAFGSTMERTANVTPIPDTGINRFTSQNAQNPTLDSILLGLRYYMV